MFKYLFTQSLPQHEYLFTEEVPQGKLLYRIFKEDSANLLQIARNFRELSTAPENRWNALCRNIGQLVIERYDITHRYLLGYSLKQSSIDLEDITKIVSSLDEIALFLHAYTKKFKQHKIKQLPAAIIPVAEAIELSVSEINMAVLNFENIRNSQQVREAIIGIHSFIKQADTIYQDAIAKQSETENNQLNTLKKREILSNLTVVKGNCNADESAMEGILLKSS